MANSNTEESVQPDESDKETVVHKTSVAGSAKWTETTQNKQKEMTLHSNDEEKFQLARCLHEKINEIRESYKEDWKSTEINIQQRGVALYFIDELALRAGYGKKKELSGEEENIKTFGCCSLRVKHVKELHEENGKFFVHLSFDGKSNVLYNKRVAIEELPFAKLKSFIENKADKDKLFDQVTAEKLNGHLDKFIKHLTTKVFRTYHASLMFEKKLNEIKGTATCNEKIKTFKNAVSDASILLNHKTTLNTRLYYLDPQITVAWCLKNDVPIDEVYTETEQNLFKWAIDKNDEGYCYEKPKPVNSLDVIISGLKSASLEDS